MIDAFDWKDGSESDENVVAVTKIVDGTHSRSNRGVAKSGHAQELIDGPLKVCGVADFPGDTILPGMAHAALAVSAIACGRITDIYREVATAMPGALLVLIYEDVGEAIGPIKHLMADSANSSWRPLLLPAIRYAGQIAALVVAETPEIAASGRPLCASPMRASHRCRCSPIRAARRSHLPMSIPSTRTAAKAIWTQNSREPRCVRRLVIFAMIGGATAVAVFGQKLATLNALLLAACIAGFFTNGATAGLYAVFAQNFPARLRAGGTGLVIGIGRGGAALGPIIAGLLFTAGWSLAVVAPVMACGCLVGAVCLSRVSAAATIRT